MSVRVPAQPGPSGAPVPGRPARPGGTAEAAGTDAYGARGASARPGETGGTARDGAAAPYAAGEPAATTDRPSRAGEPRRTSYDDGGTDAYGARGGAGAAGQPNRADGTARDGEAGPHGARDAAGRAGWTGQAGGAGGSGQGSGTHAYGTGSGTGAAGQPGWAGPYPAGGGAGAAEQPGHSGGTSQDLGTHAYGTGSGAGAAGQPGWAGGTGGTARDGDTGPHGARDAAGRADWTGQAGGTGQGSGTHAYGAGSGAGAAGQPGWAGPYAAGGGAGAAEQPGHSGGTSQDLGTHAYGAGSTAGAPGQPGWAGPYPAGGGDGAAEQPGLPGQRAYPGRPGGSGLPGQAGPDAPYGQPGQPDGSGHANRAGEAGRHAPGRPGGSAGGPGVHDGHAGHGNPGGPETGQAGEAGKRPRGRGIGAWARRLTGGRSGGRGAGEDEWGDGRDDPGAADRARAEAAALRERWPDPASVLLTALGPGPRLWERGPDHPDLLTVRLGTADRHAPESGALLPSVPVTVGLREAGSLGLAGPRGRLSALARSVLAQLAALHAPASLEFVLISADRARPVEERLAEWSWLGWLPQLRPVRGQDCRLLVAYDREQAAARTAELVRRLDEGPLGPHWPAAAPAAVAAAAERHAGPYTVVIVDGDPGSAELRETVGRLAVGGPAAGIHLVCLADAPATTPASPVPSTLATARTASPAFPYCGAVALLSGDVATVVQVIDRAPAGGGAAGGGEAPTGPAVIAAVDAVSRAWAERFARALAPLRMADGALHGAAARVAAALPRSARLLDELGLARATPASLTARWAAATDRGMRPGGRAVAVLGAGPHGPLSVDLAADGPHLLVEGCPGSGKTELLRSLAASLAAADRPDRLSLVLVDGAGAERGEGLRLCTDLPHVSTYLAAADPVRMREFAQALTSELKRRAELLGRLDFTAWHTQQAAASAVQAVAPRRPAEGSGDLDSLPTGTLKLRTQKDGPSLTARTALPRLVVLVDDFDALVAPALGSTGRPAAGSVVRALEAVARDGERLGVHLVAASGRPDRTADTAAVERAGLRATLEIAPPSADGTPGDGSGAGEPAPGRGRLMRPDDDVTTPFQAGRVTGRIPRTATLRPTVVTVDWQRMGDPPTRRPVRELGNGPTDLALLASALQRAAQSAGAEAAPPLL
ncbi:hypothetical protein FGW37_12390 [Streptomyces rectiverticillatus]|nr:hypothetical protein FGW37_12390 [Streptomyces rectiverticillatus]